MNTSAHVQALTCSLLVVTLATAEGGEDAGTATPIESLPFTDTGDTSSFADDMDAVCPYTGSISPDVFYTYTPAFDERIDIVLCDSAYDTKVYVLNGDLSEVACNDDGCADANGNPFRSVLQSVLLIPNETYYIVVDGWSGDAGVYDLTIERSAEQCPSPPPYDGSGAALDFDGTMGYVDIPSAPELEFAGGESITLEAWVRADAFGGFRNIFTKSSDLTTNYALRATGVQSLHFFYRNASETGWFQFTSPDNVLAGGAWHHVALTHTFGTADAEFYVNGQPVGGTWGAIPNEGPAVTGEPLWLGASAVTPGGGPERAFDGLLDEMRIWNVVRTQEQIQSAMALTLDGDEAGLAAYWRLEEGKGGVAEDLAGDHHGSLVGPTWVSLVDCTCTGDINSDFTVGFSDLLLLLAAWGPCGDCPEDLNGNLSVDFADLLLLLADWGECIAPTGACCLTDGCQDDLSAADCTALGGEYQGWGATCGASTCLSEDGWVVTAPFSWGGDTCNEEDDCPARPGLDERWVVTIPFEAEWTFSVCGAVWDSWIGLGTAVCLSDVGFNDDAPGCSTASELTVQLTPGTYYLVLDGFFSSACGDFTMTATAN